jgi:hypothetical protein
MSELYSKPIPLKEMTPEQEEEFINKIKEDLEYYIQIPSNVEIGDTTDGQLKKLRARITDGTYSMPEIVFELQYDLWSRQKRHPETTKLIVSDIQLTVPMFTPDFAPIRGLMIKMKYE